jgi:hypothetical protein
VTLATSQRATQTTTPYVGLRPFESRDSAFFFGRRTQVKKLLELLHLHRFLPVVGSSGCGKSSLIRAGLIPALRAGFLVQDRDQWNVATLTPGDSPLGRLTTELVRACFPGAPPSAPDALRFSIEEQGEGPLVEWLRVNLGTRKNLLLCVDQFEEIFAFRTLSSSKGEVADESATSAGPPGDVAADDDDVARARTASRRNDADRFVALLLELARRPDLPVYIVLTMRSDFLGDCDVFRGLPEAMNETRYLVPRLTREQLAVAIEGPARLANAHLAPRLLDRMLNDIGDRPDQLPILQHALLRTWRHWRLRDPTGEGPLQPLDFELAGTLRQALSLDAEAALAKVDRDVARKIFQCLTDTDPRKRRVRRAATVAELQAVTERSVGEIARTLDEFCIEERHFLSLSGPSNDPRTRVAITHESLIRRWETLQTWVDEERDARDSFFDYAKRAHQRQLRSGALLTGLDLALARDWRMQFSPSPAWAARYVAQTDLSSVLAYIDNSRRTELLRNRLLLPSPASSWPSSSSR